MHGLMSISKIFSTFYQTERLIAMSTRTRNWSLSQMIPVPILTFYFLKIHFNIIPYLGLGLPNGPFSSEFLQFDP
jgi:hypothetical protein